MSTIAKQQTCPRFIFKIHSGRLKAAKWNLMLDLSTARQNGELVAISDSQMLRWIDELNDNVVADIRAKNIRKMLKYIKTLENTPANRHEIARLYEDLDRAQFKQDYMTLVVDSVRDYRRAVKGFTVNGIRYVRLLGTSGGVKNSTIVFVSERLAPELRRRIDNGRDLSKPLVPAKFEAYRALTCSGSIPVSFPNGIIIVPTSVTRFRDDVIRLRDGADGEPEMTYEEGAEIELEGSDGYGLMLPSLAERWSRELHLSYTMAGANTRGAWEKGMVFTFDFIDFAEKVAGSYMVTDAWGTPRDVRDAELIFTTSQVKLWDSYDSCEHYLQCCHDNHYTFGIPKVTPARLDEKRNLNYQFVQSYKLTDEQIMELVRPTINEIKDIMGGDWRKAILYLAGGHLEPGNINSVDDLAAKALIADENMIHDPYIQTRIRRMIKKRITDAKIGVIEVDGNYSILSGDPYCLCQSMFGLELTGLLKSGQLYSQHWSDRGVDKVACFRAPMSCHNNIRVLDIMATDEMKYWYRYMPTVSILNDWDTTCHALNGADKDGDLLFTTNNPILVENVRPTPTLVCEQRKAQKQVITEELLVESNIAGFGDDIGKTTNWITSMYDVQCQFPEDSREYQVLEYRIQSGMHFQQNCIDKIKGIIADPMPPHWYNHRACYLKFKDDPEELAFQERICADRKPYFMKYIYSPLSAAHKTFCKKSKASARIQYDVDFDSVMQKDIAEMTDPEKAVLQSATFFSPVSLSNSVMNRLAWYVERELDHVQIAEVEPLDYLAKMGYGTTTYKPQAAKNVRDVFKDFNTMCQIYKKDATARKKQNQIFNMSAEKYESATQFTITLDSFRMMCEKVCSNEDVLCDILLGLCYSSASKQQFVWDMCGDVIIKNLLKNNNYTTVFPTRSSIGDIDFRGSRYLLVGTRYDDGGDAA